MRGGLVFWVEKGRLIREIRLHLSRTKHVLSLKATLKATMKTGQNKPVILRNAVPHHSLVGHNCQVVEICMLWHQNKHCSVVHVVVAEGVETPPNDPTSARFGDRSLVLILQRTAAGLTGSPLQR